MSVVSAMFSFKYNNNQPLQINSTWTRAESQTSKNKEYPRLNQIKIEKDGQIGHC